MRPLAFVVGSALLLAAGFSQVSAQRSSGHSSSGHSGSSSGFHLPAAAARSGSAANASRGTYPTYPTSIGLQQQFSTGVSGINPGALPVAPFRTGRNGVNGGRRYGALYGYYPYFDPFYDSGSGFYNNGPDQDYGYAQPDPGAETANVNANLLGEQVNRLAAQVDELQYERAQGGPAPLPRSRYNAPPMLPDDETPSSAPLTLIFRDGKQIQLKSYAVMGQQIWDFSVQPVKKIAMASIDLNASQKATEANGGEFPEFH